MSSLLNSTLSSLKSLQVRPSKRLGQNFLISDNIIDKLIVSCGISSGGVVVEVGPGLGVISEKILSIGARLFAVETDTRLVDFLRQKFQNHNNFNILSGDAVQYPLGSLPAEVDSFYVIANLPYAISSPWMDALLSCQHLPKIITLIVQDECAKRFWAKDILSDVCPIAIFLQSAYDRISYEDVPRSAFHPVPRVASVMVTCKMKGNAFLFSSACKKLIRRIFTHRRKQISGIARSYQCQEGAILNDWICSTDIPSSARPEEITISHWQKLNDFL